MLDASDEGENFMKRLSMRIPENAAVILKGLSEAGYEAYVVGGCVRDSLLGREPKDWDITTSARPEQVKAVFAHTIDTGIEHGTVTVMTFLPFLQIPTLSQHRYNSVLSKNSSRL